MRSLNRADRLNEMLRLYQQRAYSDIEMAERLGVARETVYRDRRDLSAEYPIEKQLDGRYRIPVSKMLSHVKVNVYEALMLYLALRRTARQATYANPHTASALEKLALTLRQPMTQRLLKAAERLVQRETSAARLKVLDAVTQGWVEQGKVRITYLALGKEQPVQHLIQPYLIEPSVWSDSIYVVAHSETYHRLFTFRLDRIQRAFFTGEPFALPEDFDEEALFRHAWGIWQGEGEPQTVRLKFAPGLAARRLQESVWHPLETVTVTEDGGCIWEAPIAEWREMLPWVRGWGADVEVLEPEALRRALAREARRLIGVYTSDMQPRPSHLHLWAKASYEGQTYHPLLYHLLDVAACAEGLWEHALTPAARAQLAQDFGLEETEVRQMFVFLAAVHDIGKASPSFQTKVSVLRETLRELGYDFPTAAESGTSHGVISAWVLRSWLQEVLEWNKWAARRLSRVAGAHHGVWPTSAALNDLNDKRMADVGKNPLWAESRHEILQKLVEVFAPPKGVRLPKEIEAQNRILALLAGFITVADWLGSMEAYFPSEDRIFTAEEYLPFARKRAQDALKATGWLHSWQPQGENLPFEAVFQPFVPRPLQAESIRIAQDVVQPALLIVEAPTGQGKTELAFYLADAWLQAQQGRGLYIAMPTQATSNAMYGRLQNFLQRRYPDQTPAVVLAHGRAHDVLARLQGVGEGHQDAVAAEAWFLPRKRALLASFGVGTVDQALMGILQARHHYLRLFGLAHKVVIFDEVHAYDTYMEQLFLRLLTWLRAVGTSVIVLSATLPRATREALTKAWGGAAEVLGHVSYPRLTLVAADKTEEHPLPAPPTRIVSLQWLDQAIPEALTDWLETQLAQGGCAAVICNTVNRAQEVYRAVRERFPEESMLFHARIPFAWREEKEAQVMKFFGKAAADRPHRFVLVATQVVEQSLDLDFDLMVSELAPIDLLIQRAGRLHRHAGRQRPPQLETPQFWLLRPEGSLAEPQFGGSAYVYAPYILWRTYLALQGKKSLHLPADTDDLIETVYRPWQADDPLVSAFAEVKSLSEGLKSQWEAWQAEILQQTYEATRRLIPAVKGSVTLDEGMGEALDDDEEARKHPALKALTRLMAPSITLLPLYRQLDGRLTLEPSGGQEISLDAPPSREEAREMRRFLVTVQHRGLVWNDDLPEPPAAWQRVAGLRGVVPVVFEQGKAHIGPWTLLLDRNFGLCFQKEEK